MVATVIIDRLTSSGPTATPITSINTRANTTDAHTTGDTASPIVVPAAGTNYSYWVVTRLECTVAPATLLTNIKWYTDGTNSFGTGVTCKVSTAAGYTQASGTPGTTGLQLTTANYTSALAGAPTNAFTYTAGAALSVAGSTSTNVQFGDRVVYQTEVTTTAAAGPTPAETFSFQIDET